MRLLPRDRPLPGLRRHRPLADRRDVGNRSSLRRTEHDQSSERHRVVVVGGGFGGLQAAQHLASAPVDLTFVDRRNFHLFQPLTYQVATGALSPGEVAYPLRAIFRRRPNVRVLMAEVTSFDLEARQVHIPDGSLPYDTLIVAGGSHYSYFGHDTGAATRRR
jgi:NADH dehydrogenase